MSFLILAFRKLSLKTKINNGNFRYMQLEMSKQKITNQIASMQQVNASIQDNWTTITSSLSSLSSSVFTAKCNAAQQDAQKAIDNYKNLTKEGSTATDAEIARAKEIMDEAKEAASKQKEDLLNEQNTQTMAIAAMKQAANSIFESSQRAEMEALQRTDQSLDLQMTSLNTQLETWNAEYNNLDKAVTDAAKNSAPKYV